MSILALLLLEGVSISHSNEPNVRSMIDFCVVEKLQHQVSDKKAGFRASGNDKVSGKPLNCMAFTCATLNQINSTNQSTCNRTGYSTDYSTRNINHCMEIKGLCKNEVRMVGMVCCPRFKVEPFYSKQKPIWSMVNSMSIATHNTKFWQGLYEDIQISPKQQTGEFFPQFVHLFGIAHSQCLLVTKK